VRTAAERRLAVALIAVLLATLAVAAQPGIARGEAHAERLTNLAHIDDLYDPVTPPEQAGHDTYRLDDEPEIGMLWTYAEPDDSGDYVVVGGGEYDPATDTWGQGAFNADDVSRAAIVYLRHWQQFDDDHSRERAYQLLRGLAYLQTIEGPYAGNVVLWMQPDGTLNPSAEPIEFPDPSDSDASYWLARTIWAFGEGYAAFAEADPDFAGFLDARMTLALEAVDRQVIEPFYGTYQVVDGLEWPAWLIADGADASSEAIYGLVAYVAAGGTAPAAEKTLTQLAEGIAVMQLGDATTWPFRALMPWAGSRSVWHAWGDQMLGALAAAAELTARDDWLQQAAGVAGTFTPHLLAQGGPDHSWMPTPAERSQIAYGVDATLQNLVRVAAAADRDAFRDLASFAGSWYFGNNPAGIEMYDPATGRTFDGVTFDGEVNRNSGAESTIHGLLSMLVLDADPELAARSRAAAREEHVTWSLYEAEDGMLRGNARVVEPDEAWTGESLWSEGAYVELRSGGRVTLDVELPVRDVYHVMPVFHRQEIPELSVRTGYHLGKRPAGMVAHGGAGDRGITPMPGYLDIGTTSTRKSVGPGATKLQVRGITAQRQHAALDAVYVMPSVEWLVLTGPNGGQALLRSFADGETSRSINLPGASRVLAVAYDASGHEVTRVTADGDRIDAPVVPGGFTIVRQAA
jgi:hypothetical protein